MNNKKSICPHAKKCGGCQLLNLSYEEQLKHKQVKAIRLLGKFCHVEEIIGMENPYHYRNKVQAAFAERRGQIISGVYQSSTHNIVPVDSCLIEDQKADEIIVTVRKLLKSFELKPFNDATMRGFLRHVLIKRGFSRLGFLGWKGYTVVFPFHNQKSITQKSPTERSRQSGEIQINNRI